MPQSISASSIATNSCMHIIPTSTYEKWKAEANKPLCTLNKKWQLFPNVLLYQSDPESCVEPSNS